MNRFVRCGLARRDFLKVVAGTTGIVFAPSGGSLFLS